MTRRKSKTHRWPEINMATIKFIAEETARARTKHPKRPVVELIEHYFDRFKEELVLYRDNRGDALRVFTTGGTLAAMVIRIIEEGAANYNYPGNKLPGGPLFDNPQPGTPEFEDWRKRHER